MIKDPQRAVDLWYSYCLGFIAGGCFVAIIVMLVR